MKKIMIIIACVLVAGLALHLLARFDLGSTIRALHGR